jgi:peptidoglycan/LPS O-acetylase OafA/YrhL
MWLGWIGADGPALLRRVIASLAAPICAGALVAWALDTRRGFALLRPILGMRASSPAALLLVAMLVVNGRAPPIAIAVSMSLLVATCAVRRDHGLRACLEARPLLFVGTISYELYLVHVAAISAVKRVAPAHAGDAPLVFACGLALALPMAYLLHRAVGVPLEPLRARLRMPQPGAGAQAREAPSA